MSLSKSKTEKQEAHIKEGFTITIEKTVCQESGLYVNAKVLNCGRLRVGFTNKDFNRFRPLINEMFRMQEVCEKEFEFNNDITHGLKKLKFAAGQVALVLTQKTINQFSKQLDIPERIIYFDAPTWRDFKKAMK